MFPGSGNPRGTIMESFQILVLQSALSLAAWALIGGWLVIPWLERKPPDEALMLLVLPHTFRHVGASLLVPGLVAPSMPTGFAMATAAGDLVTVGLAWICLVALRLRWEYAVGLVWVFNIVGTADLLINLSRAVRLGVAPHLGAAWYGPAFVVPLMLVAHVLLFRMLLRGTRPSLARD
jgi:hypothetical protein